MNKGNLIGEISNLLLCDNKNQAEILANSLYPFQYFKSQKRNASKTQMCKVFLRDGFIDRYSGEKLLFPGMIKILSLEFPDIFKYHKNWKMTETHMIYWDMMPTIDHLEPVAKGGLDHMDNWVTTSMKHNSAKANWTIEEIGWDLHPAGDLKKWDGLTSVFLQMIAQNPEYEKEKNIKRWKSALLKAQKG